MKQHNSSLILLAVVVVLAVAHVARSQGTEGPMPQPVVVSGAVETHPVNTSKTQWRPH